MKKVLILLCLFSFIFVVACREETKNTNAIANSTPTPKPAELASGNDAQVKQKIEENWKKVGCSGATVEVKDGVATARGTIPKGKMMDCVRAAQEAGPGKFLNELTEAK
ncbi:MAG: hypothetical protein N2Z23_01995 [Pyrinomonadaceae bacterium]|nr:hypothetical protein [Pyrinomonadaceae bacterium]MCX7639201.1 hypothetical protein [Pyrinomonadaceae bacterium]MDW8303577.1 hypothetical protein [Acidobacteriota bacterium]